MNRRLNILLTDGGFKHTLGITRALGIHHRVFVLTFKPYCLSSFSRFCEKELIVKRYNCVDFRLHFIQILKNYQIDIIIPVGSSSVKVFSTMEDEIKEVSKILLPSPEALEISLSKVKTIKLANKLGIPCPRTIEVKSKESLEMISAKIKYPCVIKSPYEQGKNIVDYARNKEEFIRKYNSLCTTFGFTEGRGLPIVQEYIKGVGCGFFSIFQNGSCGPVFMHRRIREFPPSGGYSTAAESYDQELIEKYGRILLEELKWTGVAMVEFKMNEDGVPILMEINPKFWGSTDLAIAAGVNFPSLIVDVLSNKGVEYSKNYNQDLKYHWPFNGDLGHGLLRWRSIPGILRDCFSRNVQSNIKFKSDPYASLMIIIIGLLNRIVYIIKSLGFGDKKI